MPSDVRAGRDIPDAVREFIDSAGVLVIDGEERGASNGATFEAIDPATLDVLAQIPRGTAEDVDAAVTAARTAFEDGRWTGLAPSKRARILQRVADRLAELADEIAWVDTLDHGKPFGHAKAEITMASNCFRYFSGWVEKVYGETVPSGPDRFLFSLREPVGVCGQIIPWNFPFLMAAWKVAPALAFGNTVVLKPAEQTPLSALWLLRVLKECGVPDGVANLVQGVGEEAGAAIVAHPEVDKIAFTGSTEVGKLIMRNAADHLAKVTLELGGKSPFIVFDDVDVDTVAKRAAFAIFYNSGEVCTAGSRLVVHERVHDEIAEKVAAFADATTVGPGWSKGSRMGPVIDQDQFDRVASYVDIAKNEGAELLAGGSPVEEFETGYFYRPTVFDKVGVDMRIAQEEVFGPVLAIQTYSDEDEAVHVANSVEFGLASSIWTNDLGRAHRVARRIKAGTVWVNTYGDFDDAMSFGGYKQSGFGRELGKHAVEAYTQIKSVWVAV